MSHALELDERRLVGMEILGVELMGDAPGDVPDGDHGSIILYLKGMRLYADCPTLYSDDSGDVPAETT